MECFVEDQTKKPRKPQMSREKRLLANRHERERVRKMNDAYEELRRTFPNYEEARVKTKLELLRIATNYILSLKEHLQSVIQDGYKSSVNVQMYASAFEMDGNGTSEPGPQISDYPYPPQFPASPSPPSQLPLRHFTPRQADPSGPQFTPPMPRNPDSSSQDFCSLFTSSLVDVHSEESILYNQNAASSFYCEDHLNSSGENR